MPINYDVEYPKLQRANAELRKRIEELEAQNKNQAEQIDDDVQRIEALEAKLQRIEALPDKWADDFGFDRVPWPTLESEPLQIAIKQLREALGDQE